MLMTTNDTDNGQKKLREAMLQANGISPAGPPPQARQKMDQLLARDERRLRLSKRLVIGMWIATGVSWTAGVSMQLRHEEHHARWLSILAGGLAMAASLLFLVSIYATISHFVARGSSGRRQVRAHLAEIERQLEALAKQKDQRD